VLADSAKYAPDKIGSNLKFYSAAFNGNRTVAIVADFSEAKVISRAAGAIAGRVGFVADVAQTYNGDMSITKFGVNRVFDAAATWGGPWGAGAAALYYAGDTFYPGGWAQMFSDRNAIDVRIYRETGQWPVYPAF
jgi:hypothetical protein